MTLKGAVEKVAEIREGYCKGLQAMKGEDRKKISSEEPKIFTGSIYLDEILKQRYPNDRRRDYGIGVAHGKEGDVAIWIEVHPASSGHIQEVLDKLAWLKRWLLAKAHSLNEMTEGTKSFVWISSGKVALQKGSPQLRRIAAAGIHFAGERFTIF